MERQVSTATHTELVADLITQVGRRLLDPLEVLSAGAPEVEVLRHRLHIDAEVWAAQLLDGDPATAAGTAARLIGTLYVSDRPFSPPPDWWSTPLGRAIARRVGHPEAVHVPYSTAAAMLGITRQGVADLVKRGKLARHPDGGVRADSVRDRINHAISQGAT